MTFQQLNISQPVLKALEEKQFSTPTSIQQHAIPVALGGRDILGLAQTGTGKTAAFAIPVIEHLYRKSQAEKTRSIRALVLTPTRELAIQIEEAFAAYGKYTRLKCVVIYGGVRQNRQVEQLRRGADILIATPGRLLDLISQKIVDLGSVTHFVLDEADRMLDMGFAVIAAKETESVVFGYDAKRDCRYFGNDTSSAGKGGSRPGFIGGRYDRTTSLLGGKKRKNSTSGRCFEYTYR